jgi:very-short-patch-repair endonuclease
MSLPEALLWRHLRTRPAGYKFRRQHPAGPYVLDFYYAAAALCIEVDGLAHDLGTNPQRDERRDAWLANSGIKTLRIPAAEILRDLEPVTQLIHQQCASRTPKSSPGFPGEEDHAQHGGGARAKRAFLQQPRSEEALRAAPPPPFGRSPSPANAGED